MGTSSGYERFDTVVIGGGQAGLAVGYHLARSGRSFVILDASDRTGDSWRTRWDSLRVFTPAKYDGLPGWSFPAPAWSYPTKDEVADYLEAYARRSGLPVRTGTRADRVSAVNGGYVVTAGLSRYEADNVVVATGAYATPRIPTVAAALDAGIRQLHSTDYRNPAQLVDGDVLVVGAGNSGAEIALDCSRGRRVWLSGRDTGQEPVRAGSAADRLVTPAFWFLLSRVLTVGTPLGRRVRDQLSGHGLPLARVRRSDLARAGVERLGRLTDVHDGRPVLADGRVLEPANVIWCTGFAADFSWIDIPVFGPNGQPRQERGIVREHPGLYFLGLFFQSTAASPLIGGVGRDARYIAHHIASRTVATSGHEPGRTRHG